jgi:hypothetical protein
MFFKIHSEKFRKIISGLDFKKIQVFNKIIKSKKKIKFIFLEMEQVLQLQVILQMI